MTHGVSDHELFEVLAARLHLNGAEADRTRTRFFDALQALQDASGSSAALSQEEPGAARACALWLLTALPGELGIEDVRGRLPLGDLLRASHTNLVSFFRELPVVLAKLRPRMRSVYQDGAAAEQVLRLREWQETLVSLTILAKKFQDLFGRFFRCASMPKQEGMQAGWLLYLLLKMQLLPQFPDLVSCLQLLVCSLAVLASGATYSDAELRQLRHDYPLAANPETGHVDMLCALALAGKVDTTSAREMMPAVEARVRALLGAGRFTWLATAGDDAQPPSGGDSATVAKDHVHHVHDQQPRTSAADAGCSLQLGGVLADRQQLRGLVAYLDGAYTASFQASGEIDEREFLTTDFGALASPRSAPAVMGGSAAAAAAAPGISVSGNATPPPLGVFARPPLAPGAAAAAVAAANGGRMFALGLQSPLPLMHLGPPGPATPVTQAMTSVSWLRALCRDAPAGPAPLLQRQLDAAGADVAHVLSQRIEEAATMVYGPASAAACAGGVASPLPPADFSNLHASVARDRREEGVKLYWHMLGAMLRAEEGRAGLTGVTSLTMRWSFHQCLLALSFEMVAAAYRMAALSFPAVPARLRLPPFDLSKMIGPFVRAEPALPRDLKRHLFTIEEKILESVAWQPGSSIYKVLRQAAAQQAAAQDVAAGPGGGGRQANCAAPDMKRQRSAGSEAGGDTAAANGTARACGSPGGVAARAAGGRGSQLQPQPSSSSTSSGPGAPASEREQQREETQRGQQEQQEPLQERQVKQHDQATTTTTSRAADDAAAPSRLPAAGPALPPQGSDASQPTSSSPNGKRARANDASVHSAPSPAAGSQQPPGPLPQAIGLPPGGELWGPPPSASRGEPPALAVLHDFGRKVLKLAAFRLVAVSDGLDFRPMARDEVLASVHDVLAVALYTHTHLFYGRHLDQLLLSSLYGFCKVNRLPQISFREIINHYRTQPQAKQEIFRSVVLERTDPGLVTQSTGDIIAFYNQVFVPAMKATLLSVGTAAAPASGVGATSPAPMHVLASPLGSGGAFGAARHQHLPGHLNRSPIYAALQHAAAAAAAAQCASGSGQLVVRRSVGTRSPLTPAQAGAAAAAGASAGAGSAYRTLMLDTAGAAVLGALGGASGSFDFSPSAPSGRGGAGMTSPLPDALLPRGGAGSGKLSPSAQCGSAGRTYVPSRLGKPPSGLPPPAARLSQASPDVDTHSDQAAVQAWQAPTALQRAASSGSPPCSGDEGSRSSHGAAARRGVKRPLIAVLPQPGSTSGMDTLLQALDSTAAAAAAAAAGGQGLQQRKHAAVMQDS